MNNGLIKKIDDLGRIVIPKDIRKRLSIKCNDSLEIGINGSNICISKAVSIKNYCNYVKELLEFLTLSIGFKAIATNREEIIFNNSDKNLLNIEHLVTLSLLELTNEKSKICDDCDIRPVIIDSNCEGIIIIFNSECNDLLGQIINSLVTKRLDISC